MNWTFDRRVGKGSRRTRKVCLIAGAILACLFLPAVGMGGWALGLQLVGNIHVVEPGHLYRAAQLNGAALDDVLDHYGIRTVINLRGANEGKDWYDNEIAVTRKHGLIHLDVRMSATSEPDEATVAKLIQDLRASPGPILIHCQSGSDRTGFASALYERFVAHHSITEAAGQLSFWYGHFPWLGSRTIAMDNAFERIAATVR